MSVTEVVAGVSYTFGPYRLDPQQATLFREGEPIPLTPKVFDTLRVLVENAGRLLSRQELLEEVWPDSIVVDGTLSQNIWVLRTALGEDEETKYIETVPRRGYRFIASVQRIAPEPVVAPPPPPSAPIAAGESDVRVPLPSLLPPQDSGK